MSRLTQLATRAVRRYMRPVFPTGPFVLVYESGFEDGLFYAKDLAPTTLPGKPWGFFIPGTSPKVYRVVKQKGNDIWTEDFGKMTIQPVDQQHLVERPIA